MFCPKCTYEYGDSVNYCPVCDVDLVPDLPPAEEKPAPSFLPLTARLAFIGTVGAFSVIATVSLWPSLTLTLILAVTIQALILMAELLVLVFFIEFLRQSLRPGSDGIKVISTLAVVGQSFQLLLPIKGMLIILQVSSSSGPARLFIESVVWPEVVNTLGAMILLLFFDVLARAGADDISPAIRRAARWASFGSVVLVMVALAGLFGSIGIGIDKLYEPARIVMLIGLPFMLFAVITHVYFYTRFFSPR